MSDIGYKWSFVVLVGAEPRPVMWRKELVVPVTRETRRVLVFPVARLVCPVFRLTRDLAPYVS